MTATPARRFPSNTELRFGVWLTALILDGLHQRDAALRMYQRFLEIDPNSNAAIYARDKLQTADAGKPATHSSKP
jgi:hypothetical protein